MKKQTKIGRGRAVMISNPTRNHWVKDEFNRWHECRQPYHFEEFGKNMGKALVIFVSGVWVSLYIIFYLVGILIDHLR